MTSFLCCVSAAAPRTPIGKSHHLENLSFDKMGRQPALLRLNWHVHACGHDCCLTLIQATPGCETPLATTPCTLRWTPQCEELSASWWGSCTAPRLMQVGACSRCRNAVWPVGLYRCFTVGQRPCCGSLTTSWNVPLHPPTPSFPPTHPPHPPLAMPFLLLLRGFPFGFLVVFGKSTRSSCTFALFASLVSIFSRVRP